jgi:hypothetical protein
MALKRKDEEPEFSFNERQMSHLGSAPETRFGLTEDQRKEIWAGIIAIEDKRDDGVITDRQLDRLKAKLARKYGISVKNLREIIGEGRREGWAIPEYKGRYRDP